jgi:hypothetical protein
MRARNDVTIAGLAFATALRRILPRSPKKDLGGVTVAPAGPGMVKLSGFYADADVPAEGVWTDTVSVPGGRFMRSLVLGDPPAAFRLVFFDGLLAVNGATVTAHALAPDDGARSPHQVPTARLGAPLRRDVKPHSKRYGE